MDSIVVNDSGVYLPVRVPYEISIHESHHLTDGSGFTAFAARKAKLLAAHAHLLDMSLESPQPIE